MLSTNHHNTETLLHIWGIKQRPKESHAVVVGINWLYSKTTINPPIKKNLVNDAMTKLSSRIKSSTLKGREKTPETHQHIDFILRI